MNLLELALVPLILTAIYIAIGWSIRKAWKKWETTPKKTYRVELSLDLELPENTDEENIKDQLNLTLRYQLLCDWRMNWIKVKEVEE